MFFCFLPSAKAKNLFTGVDKRKNLWYTFLNAMTKRSRSCVAYREGAVGASPLTAAREGSLAVFGKKGSAD